MIYYHLLDIKDIDVPLLDSIFSHFQFFTKSFRHKPRASASNDMKLVSNTPPLCHLF